MIWKINSLLMFFFVLGCGNNSSKINTATQKETNAKQLPYLIEVAAFTPIAKNDSIKIIDFRKPEQYAKGHLSGAVNIWRNHIEDQSFAYGGMMTGPEQLELLFGNLGISNAHTLVIYDDNALCDATRLWWVLQNYDITKVKLLHGGLSAWKASGGELTSEIPEVAKTNFRLPTAPSMRYLATKEQVVNGLQKSQDLVMLDTRTTDEYSGKRKKNGAAKAGRIPRSIQKDWSLAVNYKGDKKFKPIAQLKNIYDSLGPKDQSIIVYCHSGVRSAHTTFVLTQLLGFENVKNYDGSWTEWSHFEQLPFERDSITIVNN